MSNSLSKYITIKYFEESQYAKVPYQATGRSAGYDLFAAETKTLLPSSIDIISLDLRWAISSGFYGKLFPRSGLLKEHFVTVDAGIIDSDFRGIVQVLLINHHKKKDFHCKNRRIAQVVFMKKFNADFGKVSDPTMLGNTKRGNEGFGSTGVQVIKKLKESETEITMVTSEGEKVTVSSEENLEIVSVEDDLQITSEKAVMEVNNEVIISETINIDE